MYRIKMDCGQHAMIFNVINRTIILIVWHAYKLRCIIIYFYVYFDENK
jgi:hypothetical protein